MSNESPRGGWCLVLGAELRRPDFTTLAVLDSPISDAAALRGPGYCSSPLRIRGLMEVTCPSFQNEPGSTCALLRKGEKTQLARRTDQALATSDPRWGAGKTHFFERSRGGGVLLVGENVS